MINKTFHFLSGLPRSGSTILASILNQNPTVYVTPTSPLLDQLVENQNIWHSLQAVKANPMPDQLTNITRELINSMWEHRQEHIIIDKNRGWGKNMPASTILFESEIKIISTTRDLPSIMASWLTLLRKNPNSHMRQTLARAGMLYTEENMMHEMWTNMVKDCFEAVAVAKRDAANRILLIDYDTLIDSPKDTLSRIEEFLAIPKHEYDFDNIISDSNDDDLSAWGLDGMHKIRKTLEKTSVHARDVLGEKLFDIFTSIEKHYT